MTTLRHCYKCFNGKNPGCVLMVVKGKLKVERMCLAFPNTHTSILSRVGHYFLDQKKIQDPSYNTRKCLGIKHRNNHESNGFDARGISRNFHEKNITMLSRKHSSSSNTFGIHYSHKRHFLSCTTCHKMEIQM